MRRLFGTDGIRGVAGEFPLDDATVRSIGRALARHLGTHAKGKVVLGLDTRQSGAWIADALSAALAGTGVEVQSAGVIPTPAVAYLARSRGFAAGVVISASHNPWTDNGIKMFGGDGYKLADAVELEIEREIFAELAAGKEAAAGAGPKEPALPGNAALRAAYAEWLASVVRGQDLSGLHVMADCANGAATAVAGDVLRRAGVKVNLSHNHPSGKNINERCGALFPEVVAKEVVQRKASVGVSFDGDADRCLLADANGKVVNGDGILLLMARDMKQRGTLKNNTVVATTMSNMGLEVALGREGIKMLRAPVGDKYVLEEMQKAGANLGGEQSGHILFLEHATTGDGLLTALMVLATVARAGKPLHELIADLKVFPQTIKNVRVREKKPLEQVPQIVQAIAAAEKTLHGNGRVVVRYSGTEALCRVMVEAESEALMEQHADAIAAAVTKAVG
ncbi:MAG: phosphoglucosamine mutase [Candidatus Koribacter versatilis]|uniref:Phosphoglucosamine mutase n=1 Tax=Candidatus Korobacter versatilis TaxID=658062 RepID=A0A932A9G8_9BACT|nr:phosphoglucosamine mutase [Candidatus Koribacter versatilis]